MAGVTARALKNVRRFTFVPPAAKNSRSSSRQPDAAVLADVHDGTVEPVRGDLVERGRRVDDRAEVDTIDANVGGTKCIQRRRVAAAAGAKSSLAIIEPPERPLHSLVRVL